MDQPAEIDAIIIGAGPAGLFASFQLGLFGFRSLLIDTLDRPGGQCAALYADKPVYDMPGFASIDAGDIAGRLLEQANAFSPAFRFRCKATSIQGQAGQGYAVATDTGDTLLGRMVVVAAGGGAFRAGQDAQSSDPDTVTVEPLAVSALGLEAADGAIAVDSATFATSMPGVFAIGDACHYPGKVRLILSAFHEAALMAQAARRHLSPDGRTPPLYASTSPTLQRRLGVEK
ncbi:FAD-dependent oxidoreductase [Chelativorans sp. ZYF759]|uniref:NAD(P)/FAD-dependent oxidoreductase n=1 Tax=Chelativorans sp. ZYF759 TaxID=2692213 RepID=UPI00145D7E59|nr:FAD-dependent oxidoreductase [Chelativorans sp. ZYF759]NMG38548.1 FAD-dependent oxidoreductase [Chelativorans sp. ZYF759]